jgi:xanthine dehydrogenase FAD-binding subunit
VTAYLRPRTLDDALAARRERPDWTVLAGGTDLLVRAPQKDQPRGVLDVFGLHGLCGIEERADGAIAIGAAAPYAAILANDACRRELPLLVAAAREIGAPQIQSRGTLGGNVGTSSPVGDTLPVLLALDAQVELASASGTRSVPYHAFCTGYRRTVLRGDELIVRVVFPPRPRGLLQSWRKVGTRRAQSISKVMLAAAAALDAPGGRIVHARLALGAVADRPIRVPAAEAALLGAVPGDALAARVRDLVHAAIAPIDDVRSTAAYRRTVAANLAARFVRALQA